MADNTDAGSVQQTDDVRRLEDTDPDYDKSLEELIKLVHTQNLNNLDQKTKEAFDKLTKRQGEVTELHKILKAINNATGTKGELDLKGKDDLKALLEKAKELNIEIDPKKTSYTKDERDRLVENIRMTIDDLNVQNDMDLQTTQRLTNERYESYQMAKSIIKPLDEAKRNIARGVGGK